MLEEIQRRVGNFSVMFLPESDAHLDDDFALEFDRHVLIRRWPGEGCFAYSILIHDSWAPRLVRIKHEGRASQLTFRATKHDLFDVIFAHYSVFDMAQLLNKSAPQKTLPGHGRFQYGCVTYTCIRPYP